MCARIYYYCVFPSVVRVDPVSQVQEEKNIASDDKEKSVLMDPRKNLLIASSKIYMRELTTSMIFAINIF